MANKRAWMFPTEKQLKERLLCRNKIKIERKDWEVDFYKTIRFI